MIFRDLWLFGRLLTALSLEAGRGRVEHRLNRLHQRARRLLAELDGHSTRGAELGGAEVDVERVAERSVNGVVQVDAAVGDLDPAGRALGAAGDRDRLGYVRAHIQGSFRQRDGPRATRLPAAVAALPASSSENHPTSLVSGAH